MNDFPTMDFEVYLPIFLFNSKNIICLFFSIMNVFSCVLAVLVLYLTSILQYDEDESTIIYHMAVFMAYFSPLFGAILSDSFLGKFK